MIQQRRRIGAQTKTGCKTKIKQTRETERKIKTQRKQNENADRAQDRLTTDVEDLHQNGRDSQHTQQDDKPTLRTS